MEAAIHRFAVGGPARMFGVSWPFNGKETMQLGLDALIALGTLAAVGVAVYELRLARRERASRRNQELVDRVYRPVWEEMDHWNEWTLLSGGIGILNSSVWPEQRDKWPTESERVPAQLATTLQDLALAAGQVGQRLAPVRAEAKRFLEAWIAMEKGDPGRRETPYFPVFAGHHALDPIDPLVLWLRDETVESAVEQRASRWGGTVELKATWSTKPLDDDFAERLVAALKTHLDGHEPSRRFKEAFTATTTGLQEAKDLLRRAMKASDT